MDGEVLRREVHPAQILLPDGQVVSQCKVFVTSHRILVYEREGRSIHLAHDLELSEPFSVPADKGTLTAGQLECVTPDGTAWVSPDRGCGCGSPLKALSSPVPWVLRERVAA